MSAGKIYAIILSIPLLLFPPSTILDSWIGNIPIWASNLLRVTILAALILLAVGLADKVDKYISIVGSVLCSMLAYILPALIHYQLTPDISFAGKASSLVIVVVGVFVGILNLVIAIQQW